MARRRKEDGEAVSLFPFLSILACVIGTLTLMIAALALGQIDEGESPEAQARIDDAAAVEEQAMADQGELDEALERIAAARELLEQLRKAEEEMKQLESVKAEKDAEEATAREKSRELAELNELRKRIPELEADLPNLDEQIAELQKQIEEKGKPKEAEVVVKPGGTGFDLDPTFVEVTANDVVIHDGAEPDRVRRGDLNRKDGRFHQLLDTVAGKAKGTIVFLIREDGIDTYNTATYVCRTHYGPNGYAKHGKLPILGQGKIDLRLFRAE